MTLSELIISSFGTDPASVSDDTRITSLPEWDSMAHMLFITHLEKNFSVDLLGDEIAAMETIGDVKKLLISKGKSIE